MQHLLHCMVCYHDLSELSSNNFQHLLHFCVSTLVFLQHTLYNARVNTQQIFYMSFLRGNKEATHEKAVKNHRSCRIRTNNLYMQNNDSPRKMVVRDIYFYGIFHAISVNLQNKDALPDEDLLDIIQNLFENWYWPEMKDSGRS